MANRLNPLRTAIVVRLLLDGAGLREVSERSGVHRSAVTRIAGQLDTFDPSLGPCMLARRRARIVTTSGREILHEQLVLALVKRAAIEAAGENHASGESEGANGGEQHAQGRAD